MSYSQSPYFYIANLSPELGRMRTFRARGNATQFTTSQQRTLSIIDSILQSTIGEGGKKEFALIRALIENANSLDDDFFISLELYCQPFAETFLREQGVQ